MDGQNNVRNDSGYVFRCPFVSDWDFDCLCFLTVNGHELLHTHPGFCGTLPDVPVDRFRDFDVQAGFRQEPWGGDPSRTCSIGGPVYGRGYELGKEQARCEV